jgi:hypothetical protein
VREFEAERTRGYQTRIRWQYEESRRELAKKRQAQVDGNWFSRVAYRIKTAQVKQRIESIKKGLVGR